MASLYEINEEIEKCVDPETGEIIDPEKLEALQMAFEEKVEGIACWIKNLKADAKALKEEKDALYARQKAAENKAESLTKYLYQFLDGRKFKSAKASISYRTSTSIEVLDMAELPEEFKKYPEPVADKVAIKEALKTGEQIAGVVLMAKQNIQIK